MVTDENDTEWARSAAMLGGEISNMLIFEKELHRNVHNHQIYSRYILMAW